MVAETEPATARRERAAALAGPLDFVSRHALLLIVAAGALIRFGTIGSQGFWIDEHAVVGIVSDKWGDLLPRVLSSETNPPLYVLLAKAWQSVFGIGEVGLRSLSALAGTATIPVVYGAGRALGSRRAGLFAAALTATSPFMIWYSQEARPYPLFALFAAAAFLCFVEVLQARGTRWLWGWAIASVLAFSTHYFGFILAGVEAAWMLWRMRGSRVDVALASGAVGAGAIPVLLMALAQRHLANWISLLGSGERLVQVPQNLVVGLNSPWPALPPLAVAIVVAVLLFTIARPEPGALRIAVIPAVVAAIAIAIPMIGMLVGNDYLITRNLIGAWAPYVLAVAALLAAPAARWVGTTVVAALCVMGAALAIWNAATPAAGRPDWEPLAAALGSPDVPRLIEYPSAFVVPLVDHLDNAHVPVPGERPVVQEIDVVNLRPVHDYSIGPCWWVGICGGKNFLGEQGGLALPTPRGFKPIGQGQTSLFTYRRYRGSHPVKLPAATPFVQEIVQSPAQ